MWHAYPDQPSCIDALAHQVASHMTTHLSQHDGVTLAVSGGRSPIPLFERLAQLPLPWKRVRLRLVDERYVPPDHPDSNEGLVRRHLLQGPAAAADFRGLYLEGAGVQEAVAAANRASQPPDLAILGMGEDGHMASLFPNAPQLDDALLPQAACYLHITPPHAPHERISLSLAALRACSQLALYITGEEKRSIWQKACRAADRNLPISFLATDTGVPLDVHWHP